MEKQGFFKIHSDAIAVIGVNIAIAAILVSISLFQGSRLDNLASRMDSTNSRIDSTMNLIASLQKEMKDEMKDFHGRLCTIEERNKEKKS